jgi:hypothetical protein
VSGALPFTSASASTTVDKNGEALIPSVYTVLLPEPPAPASPPVRDALSALDRDNFRISFWQPDRQFESQPTLDQLATCLSLGPGTPAGFIDATKCLDWGVRVDAFVPPTFVHLRRARYSLDVVQSWTLVLPDGTRHQFPFMPGESVSVAASRRYTEVVGRALVEERPRRNRLAYVSVIPSLYLDVMTNPPFWGEVRMDGASVLDGVLIAPGDVIHISRYRPRAH